MFRIGAMIGFIGFIASMGGYEHNMITLFGMLLRMLIFVALMIACHCAAEEQDKRKRAKRAGTRKAQNKNKYYIVYR